MALRLDQQRGETRRSRTSAVVSDRKQHAGAGPGTQPGSDLCSWQQREAFEVRWHRVLEVRTAIEAGTYDVATETLADCLLRRGREFVVSSPQMYSA